MIIAGSGFLWRLALTADRPTESVIIISKNHQCTAWYRFFKSDGKPASILLALSFAVARGVARQWYRQVDRTGVPFLQRQRDRLAVVLMRDPHRHPAQGLGMPGRVIAAGALFPKALEHGRPVASAVDFQHFRAVVAVFLLLDFVAFQYLHREAFEVRGLFGNPDDGGQTKAERIDHAACQLDGQIPFVHPGLGLHLLPVIAVLPEPVAARLA